MPCRIYKSDFQEKNSNLQITSLALLPIELSKFPLQSTLKCSSSNDKYQTLSTFNMQAFEKKNVFPRNSNNLVIFKLTLGDLES